MDADVTTPAPPTSGSSLPRQPTCEELVREHMSLARSVARRYRDRGESLDDLVQVAYLGLVKAANNYREGEGANFAAYAVPTMTGELRRYFRDRGWDVRPPRRLQEIRARARSAEETLVQELRRQPRSCELAEHLGIDVHELEQARLAAEGYDALSLDAPPPGSSEGDWAGADSVADLYVAAHEEGEEPTDAIIDESAIDPLLARLDERDQLILALRFYGGQTQQQIAQTIGVTQMQVSRLLSQVLDRLRTSALDQQPARRRAG